MIWRYSQHNVTSDRAIFVSMATVSLTVTSVWQHCKSDMLVQFLKVSTDGINSRKRLCHVFVLSQASSSDRYKFHATSLLLLLRKATEHLSRSLAQIKLE